MTWNKNLPDGDKKLSLGDDDLRANAAAIEAAFDLEHDFTTAAGQTGRHHFGYGNTAARNAATGIAAGTLWFNTEIATPNTVLQVYDGAAWDDLDVFNAQVPRLNLQNVWTKAQWAGFSSITPGAGSPMTLAIDFAAGQRQYATLTAATKFVNPTHPVAASGSELLIDITMGGAGGYAITWDNLYVSSNGLTPVISSGVSEVTRVFISALQNGKYLVSTAPNCKGF